MTYTGILKRNATCAICKKGMPVGELVYFDSSKQQGSHLVHKVCWDDLLAERGRQKPTAKPAISTEPLDPPF